MNLSCSVSSRFISCASFLTSAYLNSVRVDRQIGGSDVSLTSLDVNVRDGGMYELVFGSIIGNLSALLDLSVVFRSLVNSPENGPQKQMNGFDFNATGLFIPFSLLDRASQVLSMSKSLEYVQEVRKSFSW